MKTALREMLIAAALFASQALTAQAPAGAPTGATGLCNDGSYWTGATKSGACRGHKGIKTWYASASPGTASAPPPPTPPPPRVPPPPAATPTRVVPTPATAPAQKGSPTTPAPGGGPGLVWL